MKETEVISDICAVLEQQAICFWRSNNGATYDPKRGSYRVLPKYCKAGAPDINMVINGTYVGIEVKRPVTMREGKLKPLVVDKVGGVLSDSQKEFKQYVNNAGGIYVVIDSVQKLKTWLSAMGYVDYPVQENWFKTRPNKGGRPRKVILM